MRRYPIATALAFLVAVEPFAASAARPARTGPVEVQILAFNDFHGNVEPPKLTVPALDSKGAEVQVPAGGAAYLAGAIEKLRKGHAYSITVSAGDLIGASPLASAYFLDEPTIRAMNSMRLALNAVGNHEFDRGSNELLRMQHGGCAKYTRRTPCAFEPFRGARFQFLAANVMRKDGSTIFPATAIRRFGPVKIGFIGMTLKETAVLATPSGVAGLRFADEAATANALVPKLKAQGADVIVLLIHQGGYLAPYYDRSCKGLTGPILPILDKLDPAITVVVSGHTHNAYICNIAEKGGGSRLLTSAGKYGTLLTDIRLRFNRARKLVGRDARFHIVQGEGFSNEAGNFPLAAVVPVDRADPKVAAIVARYSAAARPIADRVVAHLDAPVSARHDDDGGQRLGELIADAQLAWARMHGDPDAQLAFMNGGGVRTDLVPGAGGVITYGQLFSLQPFGNGLVAQSLTGAQLKQLLEQQFANPQLMSPSAGFAFAYDPARPAGQRVTAATLNGKPIDPSASYRVVTNSFMASGGDNYAVLREGKDRRDVGVDIDALEAYLKAGRIQPLGGRVKKAGRSSPVAPQPSE
ncbi:MAG: bifunctional metallophosphatase/5'-nucleotidase [Sphingomicrobium sp.]